MTIKELKIDVVDLKQCVVELKRHAQVSNEEMAEVKTDVACLKTNVEWLKDTAKTHGTLLWSILATLITGLLVSILIQLIK